MIILYVEDDPVDIELTRRELSRGPGSYELDVASSLKEARAKLAISPQRYDLVVIDLNLPDGLGLELLADVRAREYPVAVVMVTGQGDQEIAAVVLKSGAEDYVVKQRDYLKTFTATLEGALQRFRSEQARKLRPLRVLYADGDWQSVTLVRGYLARHAPHIQLLHVQSGQDVRLRLPGSGLVEEFDVLVIDFNLPDGLALDLLKEIILVRRLSIPVVVMAASGNEEIATQTLKLGAADYLVKTAGYHFQLPSVIEQAFSRFQMVRDQAALSESEARFRRLAENAPDLIFRVLAQPSAHFEYLSPMALRFYGYPPEDFYADPELWFKLVYPDDRGPFQKAMEGGVRPGDPVVLRMVRRDGRMIWVENRLSYVYHSDGTLQAIEGIARDVTDQREIEAEMQRQLQRLASLHSIDQAISNTFDLNLVMVVLIDKVISDLKVDAAMILMFNPVTQMLEYSAGSGFRTRLADDHRMRIGEAYAGLAMYDRRVIQFPAAELPPPSRPTLQLVEQEGFFGGVCSPLVTKGEVKGVLQVFGRAPIAADANWMGFLEVLSGQAAIAIDNATLFERLQRSNQDLRMAYDATLEGWVRTMEMRDPGMRGHNQRVTELALDLAELLRVRSEDYTNIRRGALLHDIGKMALPDSILFKSGPLTEAEWRLIRQHPRFAFDLLAPIPYLDKALEIPYNHHERWDGEGYPRGLKGENIPLSARLFAVVDVWDILIGDQIYRPAWPRERALAFIREQAGKQFDPVVVSAFLGMIG